MEQYNFPFYLTAADCGPEREITLDKLAMLFIEVATNHANRLDSGFSCLIKDNLAWVLSRLSVEMYEPMSVNTHYRFETWVESLNRMFSERDFAILREEDDKVIGYARTVWMALDMDTRRPGDLSKLSAISQAINPRECPIAKCPKFPMLKEDWEKCQDYEFVTSDIDINRHVATRRYIDLLVNCWPLDYWMSHRWTRLDMAFKHEARYGDKAQSYRKPEGEDAWNVDINVGETTCLVARMAFARR